MSTTTEQTQHPASGNRGAGYVANVRQRFPYAVLDEERQTSNQLTITVKLEALPDVVSYLYYDQGGWLPVVFGNDERTLNGSFAIYYALSMEEGEKCWIVVRAFVDADRQEFPSVTARVPAAVWGEREIRDMYGLTPVGLPMRAVWCCRRLAGQPAPPAQGLHGLPPAPRAHHGHGNLRLHQRAGQQ